LLTGELTGYIRITEGKVKEFSPFQSAYISKEDGLA
jgi:hypothetical protein